MYREVVTPERIVYTMAVAGGNGTVVEPEAIAKRTGAHPSWLQMLDRLAARIERRN